MIAGAVAIAVAIAGWSLAVHRPASPDRPASLTWRARERRWRARGPPAGAAASNSHGARARAALARHHVSALAGKAEAGPAGAGAGHAAETARAGGAHRNPMNPAPPASQSQETTEKPPERGDPRAVDSMVSDGHGLSSRDDRLASATLLR